MINLYLFLNYNILKENFFKGNEMCEINLKTMQELLFIDDKDKPTQMHPLHGINKVKNLISKTRNFIGTLDIHQLSSDPKIESCNINNLPKKNYLIIVKALDKTEPLELFEKLKELKPLGVGIIYVNDLKNEEVLIIS